MIVGRLASVAKAILVEFEESAILPLLEQAINLAATRGNYTDSRYHVDAGAIRDYAESIRDRPTLKHLPADIEKVFFAGRYGSVLPANLASLLLVGVTFDQTSSMSSSELAFYRDTAREFISDLNSMLSTFQNLELDTIDVPEGKVSFDFLIPRSAFENNAPKFIDITAAFSDVISAIQELAGGPPDGAELVYTSTSDPVTGFAVFAVAATPILLFYEKILDVSKKQIDILKTLASFRKFFPGSPMPESEDVHETIRAMTRRTAEEVADEAVLANTSGISDGRKSELTNAIVIKSSKVMTAITKGARISISIESQLNLDSTLNSPLALQQVKELMGIIKPLEDEVGEQLRLLNQNVSLLEGPRDDIYLNE